MPCGLHTHALRHSAHAAQHPVLHYVLHYNQKTRQVIPAKLVLLPDMARQPRASEQAQASQRALSGPSASSPCTEAGREPSRPSHMLSEADESRLGTRPRAGGAPAAAPARPAPPGPPPAAPATAPAPHCARPAGGRAPGALPPSSARWSRSPSARAPQITHCSLPCV